MHTIAVGLREFRIKMSEYIKRLHAEDMKLIVMNHNKALIEIRPIAQSKRDFVIDDYIEQAPESRRQLAAGAVYSFAQICTLFNYVEEELRSDIY